MPDFRLRSYNIAHRNRFEPVRKGRFSLEELLKYRHELKYRVGMCEYIVLRQRLALLAVPDEHTGPDGRYRITSLYFDDPDDSALIEKLDGVNKREKFRLRRYGGDTSLIFLEKKQKSNGLVQNQCQISGESCKRLLSPV